MPPGYHRGRAEVLREHPDRLWHRPHPPLLREDAVTEVRFRSQASFSPSCYALWPEVITGKGKGLGK